MKKTIFIIVCIIWIHGTTMAQSEDLSGKKKKNQNYLAKETDKVIEGRAVRRQKNSKTNIKNQQEQRVPNKKKTKRKPKKTVNFGFY